MSRRGKRREPPDLTTLGGRVVWARTRIDGCTQEVLARRAGVSQRTISDIETGKIRKTGELAVLANTLRVRPFWLQTGEGDPGPADESKQPGDDGDFDARAEMGGRIRDLRRAANITERAAAGFAGLSLPDYLALEAGRLWPGPLQLSRIAANLQTSLDWLISGWVVDVYVRPEQALSGASRTLHDVPKGGYRRITNDDPAGRAVK